MVQFSAAICGEKRCVMTLKAAVLQTRNKPANAAVSPHSNPRGTFVGEMAVH